MQGPPVGEAPTRAIRVLHVTAVETSNYYLNNLADFADPQRVRYYGLTLGADRGFADELGRRGIATWALACESRLAYPRALRRLLKVLKENHIDIVHAHLFEPSILAAVAARARGRVLVVTRHHSDAVHRISNATRRTVYRAMESFVCRTARRIIAPAQMVQTILTRFEGVPSSKVVVIPYPQTTTRFDAIGDVERVTRELRPREGHLLVCMSRLHPEKGHGVLFEALDGLLRAGRNLHLLLVGEGPSRDLLGEQAKRLGLQDRVHFLGWRDDALGVLAIADVVVHPSLHEALPSAVIEAVMLERPIVATDVSGVRDILGDSTYGQVVPAGDSAAFQTALAATLDNLAEARRRAANGRRHLVEYMDPERVAEAHESCYQSVLFENQSVLETKRP